MLKNVQAVEEVGSGVAKAGVKFKQKREET